MTLKEIAAEYLRQNSFDGLCNDECGCQLAQLMPCDAPQETCEPGFKIGNRDNPSDWEIVPARIAAKTVGEKLVASACGVVCECGQACNPSSGEWRWNGAMWEHWHGYPIGHVAVPGPKQKGGKE